MSCESNMWILLLLLPFPVIDISVGITIISLYINSFYSASLCGVSLYIHFQSTSVVVYISYLIPSHNYLCLLVRDPLFCRLHVGFSCSSSIRACSFLLLLCTIVRRHFLLHFFLLFLYYVRSLRVVLRHTWYRLSPNSPSFSGYLLRVSLDGPITRVLVRAVCFHYLFSDGETT